ncbi:MAG: transcriptional regulator, partial [Sinomonas sp.]|nr:transcriptional regulator [Sinomonas sp.]
MFEQELGSALRYLARGVGVRIVGAPGSGRTTLAKQVVTELEDRGTTVESIFADPSLESVPFAGVLSLGVDLGPRPLGVLGVADALSSHLERSHVIAVDGVEHLDRESLAVIDVVQGRLDVPIVVTAGDAPFRARPTVTAVLGRWRQATVVIPSLRYKQVASLLAQKLGAPADVDVAARILSGSGGNLRLAARIIETAVLADRLVLRDGRWQLNGPTLVNEHLHGTIEALLHGLGSEEFRALQKLALLGPSPLDRLTGLVGTGILDRLEHRGLLSVVAGGEGALLVSVFPPVVEDYLRGHVNSSRRILRSAITEALAASESAEPARPDATDAVAAIAALRAEVHGNHAATAQRFHTRLGELERLYYRAWEADRSMPNAVAFLRVYWGAPIDHARIREVFDRTDPAGAEPADHLFFAMTRALWMALTGQGLAPALAVMAEFAGAEPGWAPEAEAWSLLLETAYERVPADLGVTLARLSSRNPRCGVVPIVRGLLEIIRFNPEAALRELDSAAGFESIPRFEPLVRGLGLFASGRVDEAIAYALERRRDAQLAVDQFTLVTQSYIAALALIDRGLFDEAEYIMGSAFALGRPGFLVDSLYNAMLRLSSLRLRSASLGGHAGNSARSAGTLPGVGKGVYEIVTQPPAGAEAFDGAASHLIDEQLAHGYAFDAAHTALFT